MKFVSIKKEKSNLDGETKFVVNALALDGKNGQQRKIPHPLGNSTIAFATLEEAKRAIELAGFLYILPDGTQEISAHSYIENSSYDKKVFDALMLQTKDTNPNIVATAISALSEINHDSCVELYIEKIGEDNEAIRSNSIDAILKYGIEALPRIFQALKSENWVKRNSAIICLQRFCEISNTPIEKIIEALLIMVEDNNPIVKCSAIKALGIAYKTFKTLEK